MKACQLIMTIRSKAWLAVQAPQCGYCQSGQVMAAALLDQNNQPLTNVEVAPCLATSVVVVPTHAFEKQFIWPLKK